MPNCPLRKFAKASRKPNENCEFHKSYENYENYENSQRSQRHPMRITKLQKLRKFAKVPKKPNKIPEGHKENCEFYQNYENYENSQRSQRNPTGITKITKTVKIRKGTEKTLQELSLCCQKLRESVKFVQVSREKLQKRKIWNSCLSEAKNRKNGTIVNLACLKRNRKKIVKFVNLPTLKRKIVTLRKVVKFRTVAKNRKIHCGVQSWT